MEPLPKLDDSLMDHLDLAARNALSRSNLRSLPADVLHCLTGSAARLEVPAGSIIIREGAPPSMFLVVAGLIRTFLISPSARQSTVRYARPGDLVGTATLFINPHRAASQALTDAVVLAFNAAVLTRIAAEDPRVGLALCTDLAERVRDYFDQLYDTAFGTLRQRVIRHLLDRARQEQQGSDLVVALSQQDLADAVGSVREVVARVLQTLRREGFIATKPDGLVLLDPLRLHAEALSRDL